MYGTGEMRWFLYGSGLLIISMLLDRADGVLARLANKKSAFGHRFDLTSDVMVNMLVFVGLGIGLRGGTYAHWAPLMGVIVGISAAAIFVCVMVIENSGGAGAANLPAVGGFDADDFMFVVPIAVVGCGGEALLAVASFTAPIFALGFIWRFRRELFSRRE